MSRRGELCSDRMSRRGELRSDWLSRQGEVECCEEIKAFVIKHNIKQQQIASLAGTSIPPGLPHR